MSNVLSWRGYTASVQYDAEDNILFGKVDGIKSRILFDSTEAATVEDAFRAAVDEYLEDCAEEGIEPEKPYKGTFNVRIEPELHRECAHYAAEHGTTLNGVVRMALMQYVHADGSIEVVPETVAVSN